MTNNSTLKARIDDLRKFIENNSIEDSLSHLADQFPGKTVFSTNLGYEDQAITHMILFNEIPVRIFTLDTGRHFQETYDVLHRTNKRYKTKIETYFPDNQDVEKLVNLKGPFSFYETVENRKECCHIRKVAPLARALKGMECWITGIRAEQSPSRKDMEPIEWDEQHQLIKFHPLYYWTFQEVKEFVKKNHIPYNALQDKGFPSLGCAPCTRAIKDGEDIRAGRWWWETTTNKECGIHIRSIQVNNQ